MEQIVTAAAAESAGDGQSKKLSGVCVHACMSSSQGICMIADVMNFDRTHHQCHAYTCTSCEGFSVPPCMGPLPKHVHRLWPLKSCHAVDAHRWRDLPHRTCRCGATGVPHRRIGHETPAFLVVLDGPHGDGTAATARGHLSAARRACANVKCVTL